MGCLFGIFFCFLFALMTASRLVCKSVCRWWEHVSCKVLLDCIRYVARYKPTMVLFENVMMFHRPNEPDSCGPLAWLRTELEKNNYTVLVKVMDLATFLPAHRRRLRCVAITQKHPARLLCLCVPSCYIPPLAMPRDAMPQQNSTPTSDGWGASEIWIAGQLL